MSHPHSASTNSPFVLIHGGNAGGWSWKKVRACLETKGHSVATPTLTGLGDRKHLNHPNIDLETHIQDVLLFLHYEELTNVTLVGHSYGGMVIAAVADRAPERINRLVYVDALLPWHGESLFDIVPAPVRSYLFNHAKDKGDGWQISPGLAKNYGCEKQEDCEWFDRLTTPHPLKSFQQPISLQGKSDTIKKCYIKSTQDHDLDSMLLRAKNMGMPCFEIDAGHIPMVTAPEKLTELLISSE